MSSTIYRFTSSPLFPQLNLALGSGTMAKSKIFTEYIMAKYHNVNFTDAPINPAVNYHFICAFAVDTEIDAGNGTLIPTDGNFKVYWGDNISGTSVTAIKQNKSNVKVAVGIGGATLEGQEVKFTVLSNVNTWVDNAYTSLKNIIEKYNLDGIDIDFESFSNESDTPTFTECIGRLITKLKSDKVIEFASIAPYNDTTVQEMYKALWASTYRNVIDYVNFQFYAYPEIQNAQQYVQYYDDQVTNYPGANVLAGFSTGNEDDKINNCLNGCRALKAQGRLNGIFNWSADNSLVHNRFNYEAEAQNILTGS
ncbi:Chitinase 2 [Rhynchospora pubera]|uniref:Chitinase 2 n=1 Tax=Rhynchospora pubera TaxID=906938 RepID=A0AAV8FT35_9POAL|nr:Chitinase 2 [Rhynchospora pubera]